MDEKTIWTGKTSHVNYLITYSIMICAALFIYFKAHGYYRYLLAIPAIWNMWTYLSIESSRIVVTNQRIIITHGIINRYREEIELFRIKDLSIYQPLLLRLHNCANLSIITSDKSNPNPILSAVPRGDILMELIRNAVIEQRKIHSVREMDINN